MKNITDSLKNNDDFLLISHVSPDGDTLGSTAALYLALKSMGKNVTAAVDGHVPEKLRFLRDYLTFKRPEEIEGETYSCAVSIDVADMARMGKLADKYLKTPVKINIDHHPTNTGFGDISLIECKSSTGEIIVDVIDSLGVKIDEKTANCIYAAISTDTGNFIYSSVTEETFLKAARMRKCGADISLLAGMIYSERSFGATKIIGRGIDSLELFFDGRVAAIKIHKKDIAECGALKEDTESLINYAREIKGVEVAVFVNEQRENVSKVSLRSNEYVDVAKIAQGFGGGGHIHAAGYTDAGTVEEVCMRAVKCAGDMLK